MSHISLIKDKTIRQCEAFGFTLVEMLMSIAIIMVIFSIITVKQSRYTEGLALQNAAADMGLNIREAQVYGISVKEFAPGSNDEFPAGYGNVFDIRTGVGSNVAYLIFADRNKDGLYSNDWTCPTDSECLGKSNIVLGNQITELCYVNTSGETCANVGGIVITFVRPEPAAIFKFYDSAGSSISPGSVSGARIKIASPSGLMKSVTVYTSGQVAIQ